jgi:hypothetical protein
MIVENFLTRLLNSSQQFNIEILEPDILSSMNFKENYVGINSV